MSEEKLYWFNKKEVSAGSRRLRISWWIYKIFGAFSLKIIAFFVTLVTFVVNKDIRGYSQKFFEYLFDYTKDKTYSPSLLNSFRHFLSYSNSLVDKMLVYSGNYKRVYFKDKSSEKRIRELVGNKKGAFFITNHIGNVEMMRAFFEKNNFENVRINIFLQAKQCEIFNKFINSIAIQSDFVNLIPVESIDVNTSIEIKEKIDNGEYVFMAGDRLSARATDISYEANLLNHKIFLPLGVLKFSLLMDCPIFFVSCVKEDDGYSVLLQESCLSSVKSNRLAELQSQYLSFLERYTLEYPYQFYHFYDLFEN